MTEQLTCQNYYKMPKNEALNWLEHIGNWLHKTPNTHKQRDKAYFALNVCYDAIQLEKDLFVEEVIDKLT